MKPSTNPASIPIKPKSQLRQPMSPQDFKLFWIQCKPLGSLLFNWCLIIYIRFCIVCILSKAALYGFKVKFNIETAVFHGAGSVSYPGKCVPLENNHTWFEFVLRCSPQASYVPPPTSNAIEHFPQKKNKKKNLTAFRISCEETHVCSQRLLWEQIFPPAFYLPFLPLITLVTASKTRHWCQSNKLWLRMHSRWNGEEILSALKFPLLSVKKNRFYQFHPLCLVKSWL